MRVLLVNTNRMKPAVAPIGLDYLSDGLIDAGHDLRLLDLSFSDDVASDISASVREFDPEVIGVTVRNTDDCYFSGGAFFLPEIKEMIEHLRSKSDAPIVLGGVGFSVVPERVMDFCGADYAVTGEGETGFVHLLQVLGSKRPIEAVPNILYREKDSIKRNPMVESNLDSLPPRRRSLVNNVRYFKEGGQAGIETKRGCNMACIYCADPLAKGRRVRVRSPKLVVDEIKALYDQGIDHFHTCDCEFNIPADHAKAVCREIIDTGLGDKIRWYAYCSVTPFDAEMADLFKRSGCAGVDFGADSANASILGILGRHFSPDDLAITAKHCHEHDIPFMYDLLVGGPTETRETVRQTIDFVRSIDVDCVGVAMGVRVYEGTAMAEYVRKMGDMATNPYLHGARSENPYFLKPVFYISPDLGEGIVKYLHELVDGDKRFFLPSNEEVESNYNYNDNNVLVRAISDGARGAYWDILRNMT
ncbi:cobalamin-dependent protein [bacterium]|nr:cobalamin-dependent protein [bacterium]